MLLAFALALAALPAAAQRVALEVPLSPPAVQTYTAPALQQTLADFTPVLGGKLSAPSLAPLQQDNVPKLLLTNPVRLTQPERLDAALPDSLLAQPRRAAEIPFKANATNPYRKDLLRASSAKVVDSLVEHGGNSGKVAGLDGENGKSALESNFLSAASLDDVPPTIRPGAENGGEKKVPATDNRPLLERVLEKVRLDDRGKPEEKKALEDAFKRMLATPTGKKYAEQFLAEGLTAHVHFEDFPDSQLYLVNGKKRFYAAQAYTDWRQEGYAEVRLNRHYVDGDPDYMHESLPSIIGHEMLGHGLWYGRAAKADLYLAFHYHELNETLARVVGWSIDHELDGRMEEQGAWTYLQDPAFYLANLKMRLPYYAVTFSRQEMEDAIGSMKKRLAAAKAEGERARQNLQNQKTWQPVLEHFAGGGHGVPAARFTLLKQELADLVTHYTNEVANNDAIIREVGALIQRMEAEPKRDSQIYLRQSARHDFFGDLEKELDLATEALKRRVSEHPAPSTASPAPSARPKDQISFDELLKMYQDDVAADEKRPAGQKHWH